MKVGILASPQPVSKCYCHVWFFHFLDAFDLALLIRHRYRTRMQIRRKMLFGIMGLGLLFGASTSAQMVDLDADDWEPRERDERFTDLSRKTGTFFRRVREDDPAAQLEYAMALKEQGRLRRAGRHLNALVHEWPDADEASEAQLALARVFRERGRYERAFREYQYLIEYYTGEFSYNRVLEEQLDTARSFMKQRRITFGVFPGFESPERAIPLLRIVIDNGPSWSEVPDIRLKIARIHEQARDYEDALAAYEEVIVHHGQHDVAREAIFRKGVVLDRMAARTPRDARRTHAALQALFAALREDLEPEQAEEARERIRNLRKRLEDLHLDKAEFYESRGRNLSAALMHYENFLRRFPDSDQEPFVRERIAALQELLEEEE